MKAVQGELVVDTNGELMSRQLSGALNNMAGQEHVLYAKRYGVSVELTRTKRVSPLLNATTAIQRHKCVLTMTLLVRFKSVVEALIHCKYF